MTSSATGGPARSESPSCTKAPDAGFLAGLAKAVVRPHYNCVIVGGSCEARNTLSGVLAVKIVLSGAHL